MAYATQVFETIDPATGDVLRELPEASAADIDAAVARARAAFRPGGEWRSLSPAARARMLWRVGDLIDEHAGELAELETRDQGQPIGISRNVSVAATAEHFRYYAGWVTKIAGETNPLSFPGTFNYTLREPIGVCALIIPWNFPLLIAAWKIAPALACANTCVVKPAEQTPLTALRLGELIAEAGVPQGVVEIVTGGPAGGRRARRPPGRGQDLLHRLDRGRPLDRARVGRQLQARVARARRQEPRRRVRRRTARERGEPACCRAGCLNSGQVCAAYSRVYVQRRVADAFAEAAASAASSMTVGPGLDAATQLGPLVTHEHRESVERYIRLGVDEGAELLCGGERPGGDARGRRVPHPGRVRRRRRRHDDRARGDLRSCRLRHAVRRRRRGGRARERHRLRPRRVDLDARRRRGRTGSRRPRGPGTSG